MALVFAILNDVVIIVSEHSRIDRARIAAMSFARCNASDFTAVCSKTEKAYTYRGKA